MRHKTFNRIIASLILTATCWSFCPTSIFALSIFSSTTEAISSTSSTLTVGSEIGKTQGILQKINGFAKKIISAVWKAVKKTFNWIKNKILSIDSIKQWLTKRQEAAKQGIKQEKQELKDDLKEGAKKTAASLWGRVKEKIKSIFN